MGDDVITSGSLESIINIVVRNDNQLKQQVSDIRLQSTPPMGSTIARIYCDNNNHNGFSLTFQSSNAGRLMFLEDNEYPTEVKEGHFIHYTLDIVEGETGTLGVDMPVESERKAWPMSVPHELFFNNNLVEATHAAELIMKIHTVKKSSLFHGVFQDTITVTIKDL